VMFWGSLDTCFEKNSILIILEVLTINQLK